jgi:hypothetical protein
MATAGPTVPTEVRHPDCIRVANHYRERGYDYGGLSSEHAEELEARLTYVSSRVTKKDVAHLFPPFTTRKITLTDLMGLNGPVSEKAHNKWLASSADPKVQKSIEWIENAWACGQTHVVVFTHLKKTARRIAEGVGGTLVTGDLPAKKRIQAIEDARMAQKSVVVATMLSVGISINNLVHFPEGLVAEIPYYPIEVLQALARLHRLSSAGPVGITFLVSAEGQDQKIVSALEAKIGDISKLFEGGVAEDSVLDALSDEDWQADILDRIARGTFGDEGDEYD